MFDFINTLPHWLSTTLIAMTPFAEIRAAIPIALGVYKMSLLPALFFSILGDMIPALLILLFVSKVSSFLRQHSRHMEKFFSWWFENVEKKFSKDMARYGLMALFIFVAVPMPGTGSWSGAAAAVLFGLPIFPSFVSILVGVIVSAGLITGASLGILAFF